MNTDVERTHKIVVGTGVALIAAIGISTVALNAHRLEVARALASATPAALPDSLTPPSDQIPEAAPPPVTRNTSPSASGLPTDAVRALGTPPENPMDSRTAEPEPAATAQHGGRVKQGTGIPAGTDDGLRSLPTGESAVVTASGKVGADIAKAPTTTAFGDGRMATAAAGDAGAQPAAATDSEVTSTVTRASQMASPGSDAVSSDRVITDAVQSKIGADSESQGAALSVTTVNGVVMLTGTAPSLDVVEHVRQVVQQVKDVRGVDTTGVKLSSS